MLCLLLSGCAINWQASWGMVRPTSSSAEVQPLLKHASEAFATAGDAAAVDAGLAAYEQLLDADPANYRGLVDAAALLILRGTAYTDKSSLKSDYFYRAMRYAELAMYTNQRFRARADSGIVPWDAADTLGVAEAEAMLFWVTALQYEFKEGMSLPSKIINIVWLQRALVFLNRVETIAPSFGGGAVELGKAICYLALPEIFGGSKQKGDEYMQKSVIKGDGWLLPRWARGKYFYPLQGDVEKSRLDLAWVASQPLELYKDAYPWRIYIRNNAREILGK